MSIGDRKYDFVYRWKNFFESRRKYLAYRTVSIIISIIKKIIKRATEKLGTLGLNEFF